jgi:hypothetical protein
MERIDAVVAAALVIILAAPALVVFLGEEAVSGSNEAVSGSGRIDHLAQLISVSHHGNSLPAPISQESRTNFQSGAIQSHPAYKLRRSPPPEDGSL